MDFIVKTRDGPARIGQMTVESKTVSSPNIFFLHTDRCSAPTFSDIVLTDGTLSSEKPALQIGESFFSKPKQPAQKDLCLHDYLIYPKDVPTSLHISARLQKKNTACHLIPGTKEMIPDKANKDDMILYIITNASQLFSHQSSFVSYIIALRQKIGYNKPLFLPCVGDPTSIGLFTYMGVDFFDSFSAIHAAREETLLFPTGYYQKNHLPEVPCNCPVCAIRNDVSSMEYQDILQHNYWILWSEMKLVRNAISTGALRELVEIRVRCRPHLAGLLHLLDLHHYAFLEERTPVVRKQPLIATTKDALNRPEIRRFQERILQRYEKPESAHILLLLPCSAKKPYSFSKSHRLFRDCFMNLGNPFVVHELIITSPLGLVPRELELTYPASMYDTAVTGHWDEDEKTMIRTLLQRYLQKNVYDAMILHLPTSMQSFIYEILKDPLVTCKDSPTSPESLEALSKALRELTSKYDHVSIKRRAYETMRSLAMYQFGPALAKILMENCTIIGKYPYQKILFQNMQLGMLTAERGLISLTLHGANRLMTTGEYQIEIYDDFTLKGSVFVPGIKEADESIRIGDEVLVTKKYKLCGIGVALMNGKEMRESTHGEAVRIRHHI